LGGGGGGVAGGDLFSGYWDLGICVVMRCGGETANAGFAEYAVFRSGIMKMVSGGGRWFGALGLRRVRG